MNEFFTIKENTSTEITEKKSRFIAQIFYVENRQEAERIIKEIKKKYHDARHNCVAYRVMEKGTIVEKSSDDGEPSGTAGAPMLEILKKQNLCNILVIVTRYFGGILLGTGGLVRAYTESTIKAIEQSKKICKCTGVEATVEIDYKDLEEFKYYCKISNINITNVEYMQSIICKIELDSKTKENLIKDIETKKVNIKKIEILRKKFIIKSVEI